ncbi:AAA family ATPase [Streptomyces sp. ID01-12c]|uniref:AAA family ATPase n=2 Tax=Streptomyces caniscabiei TaxID=2746961 RepID=A0A927KZU9_9ACTN|nr:AAA family ATPase [Streptomyces caniscabiei]MBD9704315.1 AAA family ATPase [Streptomyces caniscabiei]MBD9722897.1 AAA family ATPase [Streptomyces caniscabiei]MDX3508484.1 AAA family ATPase [Streptomyces caniscabiei]MDX3719653.1 AAA family ATPase [Streptomyces caniscabiei]MDX3728833.1 AAA family ATPase [Streptomyces caniscabiei]
MTIRILPAAGDVDSARALTTLLGQLADAEPAPPVSDSTALLDTLARLAADSLDELPEVVLVHERIGPVPALDLVRDLVLRFPAVGVVLVTSDTSTGVLTAAMDSGARGIVQLPLSYEALAERVQAAAAWSAGMRRHLGSATPELYAGPGGTVVTVSGAKGGVGATVTAVQLALAARASGRTVALLDLDLQSGDVASYLDVQFRRSVADLAGIQDLNPRVLQEAVYAHDTGVSLLLAPAEGERGEEVTDRVARQVVATLRSRHDVVVVDCGSQMTAATAAAVEMADQALLLVTPDVIAVRAAKRMVRLWDRLQIRKAEETLTVVNRLSRATEIQPALVEKVTGTKVARAAVPAAFKELQSVVDAGRLQDLDARSVVKQALWALAGELELVAAPDHNHHGGRRRKSAADRGALVLRRKGGDRGSATLEFAGMLPLILITMTILWQAALYGYTYSLAGNAADEAARAATAAYAVDGDIAGACETAGSAHLPGAWSDTSIDCAPAGPVMRAEVQANVPLFFPGFDTGWTVDGEAGAALEGDAP